MFGRVFRIFLRKGVFRRFSRDIAVYQSVLKDPRTPTLPKILLGAAVGYLLFPLDFLPDFIPILGQLDDIIIIPVLITVALKLIPKDLIEEHRIKVKA